jgi:hypothetical protein
VEAEQSLRIIITDAGRPAADVIVDGAQALLGSAAHCDVRLGPDRVAPEQLMFEQRNGFVFAELRAVRPSVLLNMSPFHNGRLRDDSVLQIGALEIRVSLEQSVGSAKKNEKKGVEPTFVAMVLLLFVLLGVAVFRLTRDEARAEAPSAPLLFQAKDKPCPEQTEEGALSAAYELIAQAEAKRERAPFLPEEGLQAVPLYRTAALCLDLAKAPEEARDVRKNANKLQAFVERDYHLHQVRVYRALAFNDISQLSRETKVLGAYLKNNTSPYSAWLDHLARDLEVELSETRKKK